MCYKVDGDEGEEHIDADSGEDQSGDEDRCKWDSLSFWC